MFLRFSSRIAAAMSGARVSAPRGALLAGGLAAVLLAITACSTNNVLNVRPDVDVGTRTAAVSGGGMQDLVPNDPYLQQAEAAQQPPELEQQPIYAEQPTYAEQSAEPEQPDEAEQPTYVWQSGEGAPQPAQPVEETQVAGLPPAESGLPLAVVAPSEPETPPLMSEPAEPVEPVAPVVAAYPRMDEPSGPPPVSASEAACRRELKKLGVSYRDLTPINDGGSCRIDHPIKVSVLPGGVALKPAATLNCQMALAFAKWTKEELNPAARSRYWSRVRTIQQMSSYSCRRINGSSTMSEHSKGNALDIGVIVLANGKEIDVRKPGLFAFRSRGFLNNVRADGCEYFTTVLGPGYNYDHRNHFHFDLAKRRNGRVACH